METVNNNSNQNYTAPKLAVTETRTISETNTKNANPIIQITDQRSKSTQERLVNNSKKTSDNELAQRNKHFKMESSMDNWYNQLKGHIMVILQKHNKCVTFLKHDKDI